MSNLIDEIEFLEREYREKERGIPQVMYISPEHLAQLREELGIDFDLELPAFHGMDIIVIEELDEIELSEREYEY